MVAEHLNPEADILSKDIISLCAELVLNFLDSNYNQSLLSALSTFNQDCSVCGGVGVDHLLFILSSIVVRVGFCFVLK